MDFFLKDVAPQVCYKPETQRKGCKTPAETCGGKKNKNSFTCETGEVLKRDSWGEAMTETTTAEKNESNKRTQPLIKGYNLALWQLNN